MYNLVKHLHFHVDILAFSPTCVVLLMLKCVPVAAAECSDECDILVPGQQWGHAPPSAPRNDLCWSGRLRTHAAGKNAVVHMKAAQQKNFT